MTFKKGASGNPKGRKRGWQSFPDRANYIGSHCTYGQITDIVCNPKLFVKLSGLDAIIMMRFYEACQFGGRKSMNSLLDRMIGRPAQYVRNDNTTTVCVVMQSKFEALRAMSDEQLAELQRLLEKGKEPVG